MQTDTYANLVKLIQALIGAGTLTLDEHRNIYQLVNRRLTDAYNTTQSWPRYLEPSEKRRMYALNVSGITGNFNHVDDPYFIYGQDANGYNVYREEDTHNEQGGVVSYDIFYYNDTTDKWILAHVAESNLKKYDNAFFYKETVDACSLENESQDFGYSLGVLHHIINTNEAITECVSKIKPGGAFLIYLY